MMTTATATSNPLHPVAVDERIDLIDVVRGFALFGVLLANLVWATTDVVLSDARFAGLPTEPLDRLVKPLIVFLVDHKFYTLFSFLFGLGFALQLSRAEQRGHSVVPTYVRRVVILAAIGLAHIRLLWYGDILLMYSIGGLGLLAVRRWNGRALVILALTLALFARAAFAAYPLVAGDATAVEQSDDGEAAKEHRLAVFDGPSYLEIARENLRYYYGNIVVKAFALFAIPQIFARFLLGLYVGRQGWSVHAADLRPYLRRALPWTLTLGVFGNGVFLAMERLEHAHVIGPDSYWTPASAPLVEAGILAMSFSYLAAIVLLFYGNDRWRNRLSRLAPVGRMALTNYLSHSALYLLVFSGIGLGLYGQVGPALCVVFSVLIFAAQMLFSRWWLARYRFGPAEWVWRTLTYGELQPMKAAPRVRTV
jgi:uncharacterized protein